MEIKIYRKPQTVSCWHDFAGGKAMNIAGGVLIEMAAYQPDHGESEPSGVALAHVPGVALAKRWVLTNVEASEELDEDTGDPTPAHMMLDVEIALINPREVCPPLELRTLAEIQSPPPERRTPLGDLALWHLADEFPDLSPDQIQHLRDMPG